jgi:hypothetical protein
MGLCHSPPPYPAFKCVLMRREGALTLQSSPPRRRFRMASFIMYWLYFCPKVAESLPLQRSSPSVNFRWSITVPGFTLHRELSVFVAGCTGLAMTRPRGRPRRGSPWKPRRPSTTPSESTSTDSSPRQKSHSIPISLCAPQLNSMAIISRTPVSILQLSQVPLHASVHLCAFP